MFVTVAICTWNRAAHLDRTLHSLRQLARPAHVEWELIVVNNNCTDATEAVLHRHRTDLPLRSVLERRQGLSHARNLAIDQARGELLCWLDDDVLVAPNWLAAYAAAAKEFDDAAFFGGPIAPHFEAPPPDWLRDNWELVKAAYAILDLGDSPVRLNAGCLPYGANCAFRTSVQRRFRYDPLLGRNQLNLLAHEETSVLLKILDAGEHGRWAPAARIQHCIPDSRLTAEYLCRYAFGAGQSTAIWKQETQAAAIHRMLGRARYSMKHLTAQLQRFYYHATGQKRRSLEKMLRANYHRGRAAALAA